MAVLEKSKANATGKIIKNNLDNFNIFLVYVKSYDSAVVIRDRLPEEIKQKAAIIISDLQL